MEKKEYERVEYACPGCGTIASQTWTLEMNKLFLEQIQGTMCPNCTEGKKFIDKECKFTECFQRKICIKYHHTCAALPNLRKVD